MTWPPPSPPSADGTGGAGPADDLPEAARTRLAEGAVPGGTWTSDLSVSELSAVERCGFTPAGMVVGMTVYQFGLQGYGSQYQASGGMVGSVMGGQLYMTPGRGGGYQQAYVCQHGAYGHLPGYNFEDRWYEQGLTEAYTIAIDRLREEAELARGPRGGRGALRVPPSPGGHLGAGDRDPHGGDGHPAPGRTAVVRAVHLPPLRPAVRQADRPGLGPRGARVSGSGPSAPTAVVSSATGATSGSAVFNQYSAGEFRQRSDAIQHCRRFAVDRLEAHATGYGEQRGRC